MVRRNNLFSFRPTHKYVKSSKDISYLSPCTALPLLSNSISFCSIFSSRPSRPAYTVNFPFSRLFRFLLAGLSPLLIQGWLMVIIQCWACTACVGDFRGQLSWRQELRMLNQYNDDIVFDSV